MDMSGLSKALDASTAPGGDQPSESLFELFERNLRDRPTDAVLEAMLEVLDTDSGAEILQDSALTYTPLLLPLICPTADRILDLVAAHSSARELVLALNEGMQVLEDEAEGVDVSDEEDENEEDEQGGEMGVERGTEMETLLARLVRILRLYTIAVSRLQNARSTPTLLALADSLSLLPLLSQRASPEPSRAVLVALCELVDACWAWSITRTDNGGEQRAILTEILLTGVTLFGARVEADLAGRALLSAYPKYAAMYPLDDAGLSVLHRASTSAKKLNLDLGDRISRASPTSLASLILLAATDGAKIPLVTPVLAAALGSSCIDAGVVMAWRVVPELDFDTATLLLELLAPLATSLASPLDRLSIAKLIAAIISSHTSPLSSLESSRDAHLLLLQLLEPSNPFDQVRLLALSIVRDLLPPLLSPHFRAHLAPVIFALPTSDDFGPGANMTPPLDLPAQEFIASMWPAWLTESANTLRLVLETDRENRTGLRTVEWVQSVQNEWVEPVKRKVEDLKMELAKEGREVEDAVTAQFVVERLEDAVQRVVECLRFA